MSRFVCLVLLIIPAFAMADSGDPDKAKQKQIVDHWMKVSRDYAEQYSIETEGRQLKLHDHPVFQHIQVVRGNDIGAVHLWVDEDDRPGAIATVFAWTSSNSTRMLFNELHSLSDAPLSTKHSGKALWSSKKAGTNWQPVPDAPTPSKSSRLRRLQARQLAKKFTSHMVDREKKRWELRAITTPIYEYDVKSDKSRGGAVFVFCRGTDIETILMLEVRNEKTPRWEFTCAKFTDYEPHMVYASNEVWKPFDDAYLRNGEPHFWAPVGSRPMPAIEKR